jgi:hypothetical protein
MGNRGQDGAHGVQEVPERKTANLAPLVREPPTLLIEPRSTEDLHATRTTLVWSWGRNDALWIKILSL